MFETVENDDDNGYDVSTYADDDDWSEWDSVTESSQSCFDEQLLFQRVNQENPLKSGRSQLTTIIRQLQHRAAVSQVASRYCQDTPRQPRTLSPDSLHVAAGNDTDAVKVDDDTKSYHRSRQRLSYARSQWPER